MSSERVRLALVCLSFALSAIVPIANDSPTGDLSRWYTDHLHNSHASWLFFHRPIAVYTEPFGVASQDIEYRHGEPLWDQMPMAYPPGMFALFAPLAVIGQIVPMSRHTFGVLGILYMLVLAHAALLAIWLALDEVDRGARLLVGLVAWMLLLRLGLQGFYDSAWIGCGAMTVRALARKEPASALRWFAVAALLHFRAAVLAPLGIAALLDCMRDNDPHRWPWSTFALVTAATAVSVATFALMYPVTASFRAHTRNLLQLNGGRLLLVLVASGVAATLAARWSDYAVAAVVGVCALLAVVDFEPWWWHGTLLVAAPIAVGAWRRALRPGPARGLLVVWMLCVHLLAFNGSPGDVFVELVRDFRLHASVSIGQGQMLERRPIEKSTDLPQHRAAGPAAPQ